jgi:hypothetical protein
MSELRTKWFAAYRAAMAQSDSQDRLTLVQVALDLMRRRAREIGNDHGSHVEKRLIVDAMARLNQRWNHQAA